MVLVIGWLVYMGYTNVWQPAAMAAEVHETAGESVAFGKELLKFIAEKDILDMLKTILPILIPIFLFKRKEKMDTNVRQKTNYVVREKMGIGDRRKEETPIQRARMAKKYNRRYKDNSLKK
jgi:hypothetical protein